MTFTSAGSQTFHSDASSGTTLTFVPGANIPSGSTIVVGWAAPLSAIDASSVADNSVQAGTANVYTRRTRRLSGTLLKGGVAYCAKTTRTILAANTVTITLNTSATRRTGVMQWWTPSNGNPVFGATSGGVDNDTTSPVATGSFTPNDAHSLVVSMQFWWNSVSAAASGFNSPVPAGTVNAHSSISTAIEVTLCSVADVGSVSPIFPTLSYTSMTNGCADVINFTDVSSGTLFTKTVTGSAQFAGIKPKVAAQRKVLGVASFSGVEVAHPTGRVVTAGFTPSGALARQLSLVRTLTGALSFSGSRTAATAYARSLVGATFQPTGTSSRIKSVSKAVSGALSFVGAQTRVGAKVMTGVFAPVGTLSRTLTLLRTVTGVFAPVGVLKRSTSRKLAAAAQYVGIVITSIGGSHLTAIFRPTGAPVTHGLPARTLTASLQITSSIARFTTRKLVSSLIASSVMNTQYIPPAPPGSPGGGGFGALMSDAHFQRYQVDGKWRGVKRVRA